MTGRTEDVTRAFRAAAAIAALLALAACESEYVTVAPDVGAAAQRVGPAEGSATSNLAIGYPPWLPFLCCIPWGWDDRARTAYGTAVAGAPGATALANVTIEEDWYWWLVATSRRLTVRGDAVKP